MSATLNAQHARVERLDLDRPDLPGACVWRVGNRVGESPTWNAETQTLLWIDVRAPAVLRLDPRTDIVTRWPLPEVVGALALAGADRVVLALRSRLAMLELSTGRLQALLDIQAEPAGNRLNDGKVSPSGRWFVFGSMDDRAHDKQPTGALYQVDADLAVHRLHRGLSVANGIAWSPDGKTLYFSDSHAGQVWQAAWDEAAGTMDEPQQFCQSDESAGRPDGAAIDALGHYWSAGVSAACLNRFAPDGHRVSSWPLPCRAPTMPCFGGAALDTLFVTSLVRPGWTVAVDGPDGALYGLRTGSTGLRSPQWRYLRHAFSRP